MTIPMEALGYQNYGGKFYTRGETIPVKNETDASDMEALRLARRLPKPPQVNAERSVEVAEDRSMSAETETPVLVVPVKPEPKREQLTLPKRGKYLHRSR